MLTRFLCFVVQHEKPIKCVRWTSKDVLVTAGWDKRIRYWDLKQQKPIVSGRLPLQSPEIRELIVNRERFCVMNAS